MCSSCGDGCCLPKHSIISHAGKTAEAEWHNQTLDMTHQILQTLIYLLLHANSGLTAACLQDVPCLLAGKRVIIIIIMPTLCCGTAVWWLSGLASLGGHLTVFAAHLHTAGCGRLACKISCGNCLTCAFAASICLLSAERHCILAASRAAVAFLSGGSCVHVTCPFC